MSPIDSPLSLRWLYADVSMTFTVTFTIPTVFSKERFDELPPRKIWDHEMVDGFQPTNCKMYPLSQEEQKELDAFIKEKLESGRIRPSKSPMASPFFFVKMKDGKLRPVQDYRKIRKVHV